MTDDLLPALVIEPEGPHQATIVWLHGLGADGHDFESIGAQLGLPEPLGVRFVLPHAPRRPVTVNGGYVMRAWYDIAGSDLNRLPDEAGIRESVQAVNRLIAREIENGIRPDKIIVAGFSQGGVIALEAATRHPERVAGAIVLSGYLALPDQLPAAGPPLPIFMAHGTEDPIVPYALGQASSQVLRTKGYPVEWRSYEMSHSVCWEEIGDIRSWLLSRLEGA
jgi:phospholipase/carboxylesterase